MIAVVTLFLVGAAAAQDANSDGCVDSYFDANGACVSVNASIGPDVSIGTNAVIASRVSIVGRVSAVGNRPVGQNTVIGRSTTIGADHTLGNDNTVARSVSAGARLETEANAVIGYGSTLGDDVFLGSSTTTGALVELGNNTRLQSGAVVARGTRIADSDAPTSIAGIIGPNVTIGSGFSMSATARIRKGATIGNDVTLLAGARIGRDAVIGDGVTVEANVRVGALAQVTPTSDVPEGTVIPRGEIFDAPGVPMTEVIDTLNYNGYSFYPIHLDSCTGGGACCAPTTTQDQMDVFCQDAGYDEATDWVVEVLPSTSCYCWGQCSGFEWTSPCCSGFTDRRRFITEVTCESN